MALEEWKILVTGRVQGVFYRKSVLDFVNDHNLSLSGYVRNLIDGRVEVLAQGETSVLTVLLEYCSEGPQMARVDDVYVEKSIHNLFAGESTVTSDFAGFTIRA